MSRTAPIIYERDERDFFRCRLADGLWKRVTDEKILTDFAAAVIDLADSIDCDELRSMSQPRTLSGILTFARGLLEKDQPFSRKRKYVHLANGFLDLDDRQLKSPLPEYYSRNLIPIIYDPHATCPRFKSELLGGLMEEDQRLIQIWGGSVLLGINLAQKILLLYGMAGGGKTTLMTIIEKLIGESNVHQLRIPHLNDHFESSRFLDKILLTGIELPSKYFSHPNFSVLKGLCGGDLQSAERKSSNSSFQFRGIFNIGLTTNTFPKFKFDGDEGAWRRRLLVIHYESEPPVKVDPQFADTLIEQERPGILNFFVDGAAELLRQMKDFGRIHLTSRQLEAIENVIQKKDVLQRFVDSLVIAPQADCTVSELLEAYVGFQRSSGLECELSTRQLQEELPEKMLRTHRIHRRNDIRRDGKAQRGFKGIGLISDGSDGSHSSPDPTGDDFPIP